MLSPKTLVFQSLAGTSQVSGYFRFRSAVTRVESVQRAKLTHYLTRAEATEFGQSVGLKSTLSYEEFVQALPPQKYADFELWIQKQRLHPHGQALLSEECRRFEPTSGSTSRRKWIPYSPQLMREFDAAASAWIFDLIRLYPAVLSGPHYWSLSWIPTELRAEIATVDDLEVFPLWKKILMNQIMAVPGSVSRLPTLDASLLATLCHLAACRDLSFLSVWSPTFLLQQLRALSQRRTELASLLKEGILGIRSKTAVSLLQEWDGEIEPRFLRKLWPRLKLISCWDSSTSAIWANELRRLFPHSIIQGKGLWATEGVVTLPFEANYPLAVTSHFYEFRDLADGRVLPSWKLRAGQEVQPLLTTGSGFFRYELQDRLKVTGHLVDAPCFEFKGRLGGGIDLVGEKMDPALAAEILSELDKKGLSKCLSLLARAKPTNDKPLYVVLGVGPPGNATRLAAEAEQLLLGSHHYRLARELGQLDTADAVVLESLEAAQAFYEKNCAIGARILGGLKMEPLVVWE